MSWSTLVDVATLQAHLHDAAWVTCDVRHQLADTAYGERVYTEGHIPGAIFLHCDRDLSGPASGSNGRHPLPDPKVLAVKLGDCGIDAATQVVVYDDAQGMIAGRLWWLLRSLGHEKVAVLDGGWQEWLAAGGASVREVPVRTACQFVPRQYQSLVDAYYVGAHLKQPTMCLVDARSPDRFRGENETIDPVGGHIPGAVNRFFRDNLQADGRLKSATELREEWLSLLQGRAPQSVVHQCGSGVSACLNMLAMEHADLPGSHLYAGSWSEWCADPTRPMTTGEE